MLNEEPSPIDQVEVEGNPSSSKDVVAKSPESSKENKRIESETKQGRILF